MAGRADDVEHQVATTAHVVEEFGRLDVLVNNTGVNLAAGPLLEAEARGAGKTFAINVLAALGWVRAARVAGLGEGGTVVNIASVAGLRPAGGIGLYGAPKAALLHLTGQLAHELAPAIRVNAVAPAVVRTRFADPLFEGKEESVAARYPLGRLGDPADVAAAVAFLAADNAARTAGQVLPGRRPDAERRCVSR